MSFDRYLRYCKCRFEWASAKGQGAYFPNESCSAPGMALVLRIIIYCVLALGSFALAQPDGWDVYQEEGTRVALLVEHGDSDAVAFRNVLRMFTKATIGDRLFVHVFPTLASGELRGFDCQEWLFAGVLSNSAVFSLSTYSIYASSGEGLSGILLDSFNEAEVGSEDWGNRMTAICNDSQAYNEEIEEVTLYIPLDDSPPLGTVWYTPSRLWNRLLLEFAFDTDFGILETTFRW